LTRQPVAVLTTTGRRTGATRRTPIAVTPYEDGYLVGGGAGGQKATPDWVLNLRATPTASLTIKGKQQVVSVDEPTGEARERAYDFMQSSYPEVTRYERWGERPLPLFILRPTI
jgi:deazaflavin-dependent oxidoreductase (nitroreductase family)